MKKGQKWLPLSCHNKSSTLCKRQISLKLSEPLEAAVRLKEIKIILDLQNTLQKLIVAKVLENLRTSLAALKLQSVQALIGHL